MASWGVPAGPAGAEGGVQGIVGQPAPKWRAGPWHHLPEDHAGLEVDDFRGRVVVLFCFQSWCPGCHSHGVPALQALRRHYAGKDQVAFVALQTVFEGFSSNTFAHAAEFARKHDLDIPIGQSGADGIISPVLRSYRTGGTPWTIIIDRDGVVRFNGFRLQTKRAVRLIDDLLSTPSATVPRSREGRELIGRPLELEGLHWSGNAPTLTGKVTLIRWWTDTCPFCASSLPAITQLQRRYASEGFQTIGVYHPKPPRPAPLPEAIAGASRLGFSGPLAVDADWSVLRRNYLDRHPHSATSVSFVLDRNRRVRFVHPGPVFHPSPDNTDSQAHRDFEDIRRTIEVLLAE